MAAEKRKYGRRVIRYPAQIDAGEGIPLRECTVYDVSEEGAQIQVADPQKLPNEFALLLGYQGSARRRCRLMWRSSTRVGVRFLLDPKRAATRSKWAALAAKAEAAKGREAATDRPTGPGTAQRQR